MSSSILSSRSVIKGKLDSLNKLTSQLDGNPNSPRFGKRGLPAVKIVPSPRVPAVDELLGYIPKFRLIRHEIERHIEARQIEG
jgi:hypothetical protein